MRPLARLVSWLVVLELGQIALAWACSCDPRTPEELVADGDPIVVATKKKSFRRGGRTQRVRSPGLDTGAGRTAERGM